MPYVIMSSILRADELKHRYLRVVGYPEIAAEEELSDDGTIEYVVEQSMLFALFIAIGEILWDCSASLYFQTWEY